MAASRSRRANAGCRMKEVMEKNEIDPFYASLYGGFYDEENDKDYKCSYKNGKKGNAKSDPSKEQTVSSSEDDGSEEEEDDSDASGAEEEVEEEEEEEEEEDDGAGPSSSKQEPDQSESTPTPSEETPKSEKDTESDATKRAVDNDSSEIQDSKRLKTDES